MDWSRRGLLGALGALFATPAVGATRPTRLVTVLANGGWDPLLTLDPHLDLVREREADLLTDPADEQVVHWAGLDIGSNPTLRPGVDAFFARWASRCVVVRGVWSGAIGHEAAFVRAQTGTADWSRPDLASIVGAERGHGRAAPVVDLSGRALPGPLTDGLVRIGPRQQLRWLLDGGGPPTSSLPSSLSSTDRGVIDDWVRARAHRLRDGTPAGETLADAVVAGRDRAALLRADPGLQGLAAGQWLDTAEPGPLVADLLARDVSAAVSVDSGVAWDLHERASLMHGRWDEALTRLDALLTALDDRGVLDDTLVVVRSELGRTPWLNATTGTDHWPVTTTLLIGGGLAGGRVVGATGPDLEPLPVDLATGAPSDRGVVLTYAHLAAGVLSALDLDATRWIDAPSVLL